MSASVDFTDTFLAPADDLSALVSIGAQNITAITEVLGDFRRYGERTRLITRPGTDNALDITIKAANRTLRETLEDWTGTLLFYRDGRGRAMFGSYLALQATEVKGSENLCTLAFAFYAVTHSQEV